MLHFGSANSLDVSSVFGLLHLSITDIGYVLMQDVCSILHASSSTY